MGMKSPELLEETIHAHGGRDRWRAVEAIEVSLSSGGFAFLSRSRPSDRPASRPREECSMFALL